MKPDPAAEDMLSRSNPDDPDSVLSEQGSLLPSPQAVLTGPTFEEWLDADR